MAEKKKKNRLAYMIMSVIIAIVSWAVVSYVNDPDISCTVTGVKVELAGEDVLAERGLVVTNRDDLPKMSVKISGKRSGIISVMDTMKVVADLTDVENSGKYVAGGTVKLSASGVTVEKIIANEIEILVDRLETREMPIRIYQDGEVEGKMIETRPVAQTIAVTGAVSQLEMLNGTYATIDLNEQGDEGRTKLKVELAPKDGVDIRDLTTLTIHSEEVEVENFHYEKVTLPVYVNSRNVSGYEIDKQKTIKNPEKVEVGKKSDGAQGVTVVVEEYTTEEITVRLEDNVHVYIPEENREIKVVPQWTPIVN